MNIYEEALIYATVMHSGVTRKSGNLPYIIHPIEVSQIASTMTDDQEVLSAGLLHDVVEDTSGTMDDIRERFGDRVASLVEYETENKYKSEDANDTWFRRKSEALEKLAESDDINVKILWLADKLSNLRSLAAMYDMNGPSTWDVFHQKDPLMHKWYFSSVADDVEPYLKNTRAFKEFKHLINYMWP